MNNKNLPVLKIFLDTLSLSKKYSITLLKIGLPSIITGGILIIYGSLLPKDNDSGWELFISGLFIIIVLFLISLVITIVGCHRTFLMDAIEIEKIKFFRWTGNELRYAGWWILIGLCTGLIAVPFMLILMPFVAEYIDTAFDNKVDIYTLSGLISLPLYYLATRWSLVLPSSAIGKHGKSLSWSWQLSKENGLRLTFLIGLLPFSTELLINLLPTFSSIAYSFFIGAIRLIICVIEAGLLSLSYLYLSSIVIENDREEAPTEELEERLTSFLISKANNKNEVKESHQEIASHLGTESEVISKLLQKYEKKGLLKTSWECITINSVDNLVSYIQEKKLR